MSDTTSQLKRKIGSAEDLQSVVRTMKALAASQIGQYEQSVRALTDFNRTIELGLGACFRQGPMVTETSSAPRPPVVGAPLSAVVFGSDQGLVGQFNDRVADFAVKALGRTGQSAKIWAVGERVEARLVDLGQRPEGRFAVPTCVKAITPLVGQILVASARDRTSDDDPAALFLFYNRPKTGAVYAPVVQRLLPLDEVWRRQLFETPWPTKILPEILDSDGVTLGGLIRGYLFAAIFRACAESLASENASRLAAMQRADKNIEELLEELLGTFHRVRQSGIDEELFDVVSGYEALGGGDGAARSRPF